MSDHTELKQLAQRVIGIEALDGAEPIGSAWDEFEAAATPAAVLALIAENERLNAECKQLILLECYGGTAQAAINLLAERDQLKAENELMRHQLSACAKELRAASDWICREVEGGTRSATHWAVRLKTNADQIDAAMGKGEQS